MALHALQALQGFEREGAAGARESVVAGLRAVRSLRSQLSMLDLDEDGRFEIDFRLAQKEQQFRQAVLLAHGIRLEALANDGVVIPGQELDVSLLMANQGEVQVAVRDIRLSGVEEFRGYVCGPDGEYGSCVFLQSAGEGAIHGYDDQHSLDARTYSGSLCD